MTDTNPPATPDPTGSNGADPSANGAPPAASLPEDAVKNHPLYKKLEEDRSAAEREANRFKGRLVTKGIPLEDEPAPGTQAPAKPQEQSQFVTKDELWDRDHAPDIEVYGDDQYKADIARGIPKDYALETAKLRFQANPDKARSERLQSMGSGPAAGTRNLQSDDITEADRRGMAQFGYSEDVVRQHKALKRARERTI